MQLCFHGNEMRIICLVVNTRLCLVTFCMHLVLGSASLCFYLFIFLCRELDLKEENKKINKMQQHSVLYNRKHCFLR